MSPSRLSTQLNTLNCESYIHFQPSTLMATGRVNGNHHERAHDLLAPEVLEQEERQAWCRGCS